MNRPEQKDYSNEVTLNRHSWLRVILIVLGTISFVLGIVGIVVPVLPTTPFLLLSAACYARASVRFYNWLMNNRIFGQYIRDYRIHKSIPLRAKIVAVLLIVLTMGSSIVFFIPLLPVKILVGAIGLSVIVFILNKPTKKQESQLRNTEKQA